MGTLPLALTGFGSNPVCFLRRMARLPAGGLPDPHQSAATAWCWDPRGSFHPPPRPEVPRGGGGSARGRARVAAPPASPGRGESSLRSAHTFCGDHGGQRGAMALELLCLMAILLLNRLRANFSAMGKSYYTPFMAGQRYIPTKHFRAGSGGCPARQPPQTSPRSPMW